jgi:hypothetical protein
VHWINQFRRGAIVPPGRYCSMVLSYYGG